MDTTKEKQMDNMISDAKLQHQLTESLKLIGYKKALDDLEELIKTTQWPRTTSKKFILSFLENLRKQL